MKIKTRALGALLGMFAFGVLATAAVAADRPYTEGSSSTFRRSERNRACSTST